MADMRHLTPDVATQLSAKLAALQGERTDADMGKLLGVTREHYAHIKANRRRMSYAVVKRAALHFPELYPIVLRDLAAEEVA
jgi:hypothetical protein